MKKLLIALLLGFAFQANAQDAAQTITVQRFRIGVQGGFSRLLAKTSDAVPAVLKDYVSELKSGYHYSADVTYYLKPTWGLGVRFSQFKSSNSASMGGVDQMGNLVVVGMEDNITHTFIGPSVSSRYVSANTKHAFLFGIALGYLGYNNNAAFDGQTVKMTSGTFGSSIDAGYDFNLTKSIALGAQLSMTGGTLSKMNSTIDGRQTTQTFDKDQRESLTRLDFSLGARFNF